MPKNSSKRQQAALSRRLFSTLFIILIGGCAPYKAPEGSRPWTAFLYDGARTNATEEKIDAPLKVSWTKDVSPFKLYNKYPKEQLSSPVAAEGAVYAGSTNGRFYSLKIDDGGVNWRFHAEYPMEGAPSVAGGMVCFGAGNGVFRCLDRMTGKEAWTYQAKSEVLASPLVEGERVYIYSADDRVTALAMKTGEKLWNYVHGTYSTVTPRLTAAPAAAPGKNKIYQLFSDGFIVCLNADTGKPVWSKKVIRNFDTHDRMRRTPLLHDGSVYIIDDDNVILALDENTGELKNIYNLIKAYDFVIAGRRSLVIAGQDQAVALDLLTGAILWRNDLKYNPMSSIFAAGDYLFAVSNYMHLPLGITWLSKPKGYIQAISLKNGDVVWGARLPAVISANASASEGRIALLLNDGTLEVFKPKKH